MADNEPAQIEEADLAASLRRPGRPWKRVFAAFGVVLVLMILAAWLLREDIADDFIASQLEELGLPATYDVAEIGPARQAIENVVIGDPQRPDMTIERVEVMIVRRGFSPQVSQVRLIRPRAWGVLRDGRVSFGSLDPLLYGEGDDEPFRLPDLDLAIEDGRGLIESGHGPLAFKLSGEGPLRDGFAGELAATASRLAVADCDATRATLYGNLSIADEQPGFTGPVRLASLDCGAAGAQVADLAVQIDLKAGKTLDTVSSDLVFTAGRRAFGEREAASVRGEANIAWREGLLSSRYEVTGTGLATPEARMAMLNTEGQLRATGAALDRFRIEGEARASGIAPGQGVRAAIAGLGETGAGTVLGDVTGQIARALDREARGSAADLRYVVRSDSRGLNLLVPRAILRGGSGETLVALSRFGLMQSAGSTPRLSGNFSTGGPDLPRIAGRMEQSGSDAATYTLAMRPYRAGNSTLALPDLRIVQRGERLAIDGAARLTGGIPGGRVENLALPISGTFSSRSGLALWQGCTPVRFDRLQLGDLALARREVRLCPPSGSAIVSTDSTGRLRIAAGTTDLSLAGSFAGTPMRLSAGRLGLAWPGTFSARAIDLSLGPRDNAAEFRIASLSGRLDDRTEGRFDGADVRLAAVPLDLTQTSGAWRWQGGVLALNDAAFTVSDREPVARFQPLIARDASLRLADSVITADALLREPETDREVTRLAIRHDLASGAGQADLAIDGLRFDEALQPVQLTRQALGVVANVDGVVTGSGVIRWDEAGVTSTGTFTSDDLDLAAAFGPVEGLSGTVRFTDLLGLVTAPDQRLKVRAINPGIEVNDGEVTFALKPDYLLDVGGARWPFMGGTLTLEPVALPLGSDAPAQYTLVIEGLDAARFIARMELANLSATGIFDGRMPLIFDQDGGRIEGGQLVSRAPGGNVSYVGELTYEDMSPIANFAFDALRSLDYREMTIGMDGAIDGEIVTRVKIRGVSQGEGTKRNFITRRIGKLPLQFNVNLRAPFFQLITSFKSLYDPAYVRDPRELGLFAPDALPDPAPPIQPPESETMP